MAARARHATRDASKAHQLATRLEAGGVCINDMTVTYGCPEAPFGGRKDSGVGQVNGMQGVRGYCHALPVITDRFGGKAAKGFYPYLAKKDDQLQKVIKILYGTALGRRLG